MKSPPLPAISAAPEMLKAARATRNVVMALVSFFMDLSFGSRCSQGNLLEPGTWTEPLSEGPRRYPALHVAADVGGLQVGERPWLRKRFGVQAE